MKNSFIRNYVTSSSILFIYMLATSFLFGGSEEPSLFRPPFHIDFTSFRFCGLPAVFINGAMLYVAYIGLLKFNPTYKTMYKLALTVLFASLYAVFVFDASMCSLPFWILLAGGFVFWCGLDMSKPRLVWALFMGCLVIWLHLLVLPAIL
jgi:hypothetical protein